MNEKKTSATFKSELFNKPSSDKFLQSKFMEFLCFMQL